MRVRRIVLIKVHVSIMFGQHHYSLFKVGIGRGQALASDHTAQIHRTNGRQVVLERLEECDRVLKWLHGLLCHEHAQIILIAHQG